MRVRFTTVFTGNQPPEDSAVEELSSWCRLFHERELTPSCNGSSLGNLSFRHQKGANSFIITASQLELKENLLPDAFVLVKDCDFDRATVYAIGTREPSSESLLHWEIYKSRSDVNAIFHGHCGVILDLADEMCLTTTRREEPFGSQALVKSVLNVLDGNDFIVMRNHGFLSLGSDMRSAGDLALHVQGLCCR